MAWYMVSIFHIYPQNTHNMSGVYIVGISADIPRIWSQYTHSHIWAGYIVSILEPTRPIRCQPRCQHLLCKEISNAIYGISNWFAFFHDKNSSMTHASAKQKFSGTYGTLWLRLIGMAGMAAMPARWPRKHQIFWLCQFPTFCHFVLLLGLGCSCRCIYFLSGLIYSANLKASKNV